MPVNVADFVARNFRGPTLPEIDRARTQNALGQLELTQQQNAVNRIPQANRMEDLQIQAVQQGIDQTRRANAGSLLARGFFSIAHSSTPKATAQQFIGSPVFKQAAEAVGWPPEYVAQFSVAPADTDQSIAESALAHARQLGAPEQPRRNVNWLDTGDKMVPYYDDTGEDVPGLPPKPKAPTPNNVAASGNPESVETVAQLIAIGQMAMPSGSLFLRSPYGQAVVRRVGELKPDFQANTFTTRSAAMRDFTSGKSAQTVRSLNVAIAHLGTLDNLAQSLGNRDTNLFNQARNVWKTQTGSDAPTNFAAARSIVANEIVKAVTASGGGVTDRQEAQNEVNAANSPEQLSGVISTWKQLLAGQLGGLKQQYEQGTQNNDFNRFLSQEVIDQLEKEMGSTGSPSGATSVDLSTLKTMSDEELRRLAGVP
jgi:hypothetical protein